jgi:hypothetical protein
MHKSYIDLAVKINLFYYAITGALLSFHFSRNQDGISKFGLILPIVLSISLGAFFLICTPRARDLRTNMRNTAQDLGLAAYPDGIVLVGLCFILGLVMLGIGIALLGYLCGWYFL